MNKIPFLFSLTNEKPQFLILSYIITKDLDVLHELIKIKPEGLFFHNIFFPNLETLSNYFKKKFSTSEY